MACVSAIERGRPPGEDLYPRGYQEVKVETDFDVLKTGRFLEAGVGVFTHGSSSELGDRSSLLGKIYCPSKTSQKQTH